MLADALAASHIRFRTNEQALGPIQRACEANPDVASFCLLGTSEEGRPLYAIILGGGGARISLLAGAHSDEPLGPETLRTFLLQGIEHKDGLAPLFESFQFLVIPQMNPDGESRNQPWIGRWPDVEAYLRGAYREPPGRDLEFGFPAMRVENRAVSEFLRVHAPLAMHASLHGMAFSEGAMLLIERAWIDRTAPLREKFADEVVDAGLRLHDHDRKGEKGFLYIGPGFNTTPEGRAMHDHFLAQGDPSTAELFHLSSMEFVRTLGGDPLSLVTELPLWVIGRDAEHRAPGSPGAYLAFKDRLAEMQARLLKGTSISDLLVHFQVKPLDVGLAMRLQLRAIELGLETVSGAAAESRFAS
jgi:hypothetical protein